jgi:predicted transcriptional regulator
VSAVEFVKVYRDLVRKIGVKQTLQMSIVVFRSTSRARVFLELCRSGGSTAPDIMETLAISEATTYRSLNSLRELEVAVYAGELRRQAASTGGSPARIWRLNDGSELRDLEDP